MSDGELAGKVALVTGAGSGLGAAFARRFAAEGAVVVVNDVADGPAKAVADEVGGEPAVFDVTDSAAFDAAVDRAVDRHGHLDIVVNNAGIAPAVDHERFAVGVSNQMAKMEGRPGDIVPLNVLASLSDADWDQMIRIHLYGAFHGCRAAVRHMVPARSGVIVNIASVLGLLPEGGAPHYSVAKAAIIALTKALSGEVAPFGVRVVAVCPGYIDTPLLGEMDDLMRHMVGMRIGLGRMGAADEVASVVGTIVGPRGSYFAGDVISVSGGYA
jgi:3-oxoacyl-[acyl-carrier protein] reductase